MNLLVVGALSWNPERLRSLHERGHRLWGLWARSMAWDQGPYPCLDGCVTPVAPGEAARLVRERSIDCVYSLFQSYHPRLWGPPATGVESDVWTLLRRLLGERARGAFDAPIVRHWGFDTQDLAPDVVRGLDGHLVCNREKARYWRAPLAEGGCGLDLFDEADARGALDFLDGDRPKLEFMNDDASARLSERDGAMHTVCIGRPFGIDFVACARRGIHVHLYGNAHDEVTRMIARALPPAAARREAEGLRRHVHVHPPLQPIGGDWETVRRVKSRWVREFSRYDAAWSYVGRPLPWATLDDRAAIPSRVATALAAGLPLIADRRPGWYRYDELARLGVAVDVDVDDYDGLRGALETEVRTRAKSELALRARADYSFDASIDALTGFLARVRDAYHARPRAERTRAATGARRTIHFSTSPDPRALLRNAIARIVRPPEDPGRPPPGRFAGLLAVAREAGHRVRGGRRARALGAVLRLAVEPAPDAPPRPAPGTPRSLP